MAKFEQGKSGNANGRPRGRPDKRNALRGLLEPHVQALVAKAVELALQGDVAALRLCMERLISPLRATPPAMTCDLGSGSLAERGEVVMQRVSDGMLAPEQGTLLLRGLADLAKIRESDEIDRRLIALEQRNAPISQTA